MRKRVGVGGGGVCLCVGGGGDKSQGLFNIQSACVNCRANILIMGRWAAAAAVYLRSHSVFIGISFLSFTFAGNKLLVRPM